MQADDDDQGPESDSKANKKFQILEEQGFVVGKTLGNGSYACVKAAFDTNRKHKVAIKIISKKKAPVEYIVKFLPREIEVVRSLNHPNLIAFYQAIETTSRFFLVMEISERGDLLEYLRKMKYIDEKQAGIWFSNLFDGISYMHSKGIAHRDLKCENVLIDVDYNLKVADFGFARAVKKSKSTDVSMSETYCGSFAYAAPEILKGIPYNAFISEVWSMGVVLFTMVFGRLPFDDSNHIKLLKQVQSRVVFPTKPQVSDECRDLIDKMLIKGSERIELEAIRTENWFKAHCPSKEVKEEA